MKLYHASNCIIESPDVYHSRELLDFGKGFYLTSLADQARKYSQRFLFRGDKAYLNHYVLDDDLSAYNVKEFAYITSAVFQRGAYFYQRRIFRRVSITDFRVLFVRVIYCR